MLTVHHLAVSQSERIVWLCEELELPYKLVRHERAASGTAPPEYKALHPFGTAPVITDGDVTLAESGAIIEYICRRHGEGRLLLDPDHPEYLDYLFWFHFANGSMVPAIMMIMACQMLAKDSDEETVRALGSRRQRALASAESRLGAATYFAGDSFTAADIMMVYPLSTIDRIALSDDPPFPNIRAYLQRMRDRPAYRRAMAKAEPDKPLKAD